MSESITSLRLKIDSTDVKNAEKDLNNLTKASGNTEKSAGTLSRSFASLSTILGTVGVAALTHEFVKIADEMKLLDARLKMVSASTEEYTSQKKELLAISKETYSSISEITTLYTKLDPALKSLGATTKDVNNITESFAKGLKLGGANTAEAASATLQFAQAMGSGVLRGEEFNAITEASPKLMKYLAEGLGVPQTALRKMAMEGELSAGRVSAALLKMTTKINEDFTQIPMTVGMATTNLKTDLMTSIEQFDKTTGATKALAETIAGFSVDLTQYGTDITTFFVSTSKFIKDHNEALKVTASLIGGVATAYYGFIAGGAIVTGLRNITTAVYALRTAMVALQASSPILLAISVALGVATAAYLAHDDALEKKNYSTINSIEALTKSHDDLLKKRKEIQSDKFALDKTQKKETAIVDGELKKIEDRLNAIGTARSNNVAKAKKESEELIKSAKTLEENAKKLAPPAKVKKEKKEEKTDEQKAAEQLIKDIAKAKKDAAEYNAEVEKDLAVKNYEDELQSVKDVQKAKDDAMSDNAIRFAQMLEEMKTPLEKLNESVLNDYNFALAMFPDGIPQAWFDNVNNKFKDLKENVSEMDFSDSIGFEPENLEGTAKAIAGIGKTTEKLAKAEAQYQKNKSKTNATVEEVAKNEEDHTKNQLLGYSAMAGSMSSMFQEGSVAAERMLQVQQVLAIVEAGVAIAKAGQGDPYTAIPRVISMAALMSQFVQGFGGGGGGASISQANQVASDNAKYESEQANFIVERLDRQIELLESIDSGGTAAKYKISLAGSTFESDIAKIWAEMTKTPKRVQSLIEHKNINYTGDTFKDVQSTMTFLERGITGFSAADWAHLTMTSGDVLQLKSDLEDAVSSFAINLSDVKDTVSDSAKGFKEIYDSLSGTDFYKIRDLQLAYEELGNSIVGNTKESMLSYISEAVMQMESLGEEYLTTTKDILRGGTVDEQVLALKELSDAFGKTFNDSTEEALNFLDSIELVSENMIKISEDTKSVFEDIQSFINELTNNDIKNTSITFSVFSESFNNMIDAISSGSKDMIDIGGDAIKNAQSYLTTVTANATAGRDINFAKAVLLNKFSSVVATPDTSLNTINSTLISNNEVLVQELQALKFELNSIKDLSITSTATNIKILSTQRSILGETATA